MPGLICLLLLAFSLPAFSSNNSLSSYSVDPKMISISGVSSGAFMAVQMGVAFSESFMGVGSIAGGIYACAQGQAYSAEQCLKNPETVNVPFLVQQTKNLETYNYIDSTENLKKQRIYIFASTGDGVVNKVAGEKLKEYYQYFTPAKQIYLTSKPDTGHGFPTLNSGGPCQNATAPWILNCHFDAAAEILKQIYGDLNARGTAKSENLIKFDQNVFGDMWSSLEQEGWVYVPENCKKQSGCKLHVALHGCQMSSQYIQDQFVKTAGYNEWAESNNIIILYPQASQDVFKNPYACWDWYGYTGVNYTTKYGSQMAALMKMIRKLQ